MNRLRSVLSLFFVAVVAACFPGAKAPNVAPQRTLDLRAGELAQKGANAPFAVVFAGPKGRTDDPSEVTVVWNRPLRALDLAGEERVAHEGVAPPVTITPAVKGSWRWLGTSALVFVPEKALPRATKFEVTIPGATRALDGGALGKDYTFDFETARPRVVHFTPGDGADHLVPTQGFELRFNQPIDPKEVQRAVTVTAGKNKIAFSVTRPKSDVPMLFAITPAAPLPLATDISIAVDGKLTGTEGPLPSDQASIAKLRTYGPLGVREVQCSRTERKLCLPHGSVHVELANRVSMKEAKAHIRIEPNTIAWPKSSRDDDSRVDWISIPTDLGPARTYKVIVSAGMKDEFGQVLAKDFTQSITTDDESPSVVVGLRGGGVLEAAKAKGANLPIAQVNTDRYDLVTAVLEEDDAVAYQGIRDTSERYDFLKRVLNARVETVKPGAARNVMTQKNVNFDQVLATRKGKGTVAVGVSRPGRSREYRTTDVVSVTDLAITARLSRFGSIVYLSRLSDGKPVPSASVVVRRTSGKDEARALTDAAGFATFPPEQLRPIDVHGAIDRELVIVARAGEDWTWKNAAEMVSRAEIPQLDLDAPLSTFGMLFTDRGIYKPGETVRLKGVFRTPLPRGTETPKGKELTLRVDDPEGNKMLEQKVVLGAFGEAALDVPLPKTMRLGHVQITATDETRGQRDGFHPSAASTAIEVAAYRAAEFKVTVEPNKPAYIRGDKASFTAQGDYLFGAPMTGGRARYTVTRSRTSFRPEGTDGFTVDDDAYAWGHPETSLRGGRLQSGDGALDGQGRIAASVALSLPNQIGPESVTFEADIEDLSRQTIANHSTVIVHPAEYYVALKQPKDFFVPARAALRPEVAAFTPDGKRVTGVPVEVELVARSWQTATETDVEGDMHYESRAIDKVVGRCTATTSAETAVCDLPVPEAGYFLVRAKSKDKKGNAVSASYGVYVEGDAARVAWAIHDGPNMELVTDKKSYEVGETATILVKSPYQESDAIVTIERQGIMKRERLSFKGTMPTVKVPVTEDMRPNMFVSVELIKARSAAPKAKDDVGAPAYKIGYAQIAVNPEARRLAVDVRPSKKVFAPGEEIDVELLVTDRKGVPTRADVAFYAVDEGVLMLTGYKTPDPIPVFARHRSLSVAPVETRDGLARLVRFGRGPSEDKGDEGGGGGEGAPSREDFRTTAFFQPSVVTGKDGKAKVHFKLPDSLTTYRLMAVATGEDDRFGFAEKSVVTSRPLMARPALPRFLRAGDAIAAGVILTSKGLAAGPVTVELATKGLSVSGEAKKTVTLPADKSVEVRFDISAKVAGSAELAFRAIGSGGSDAVTVKREVQVPGVLEAVALYGDTEGALAEKLGNLAAMRSDVGGLDLRVASTALVGLDNGVESLLEYPYGCAEQLTSKMIPLVALADLAKDYGVKLPKDPNAMADEAIAKILRAQRSDGGFGYWPDAPHADVWLTAYALWGLHLAKERGRPVPGNVLDIANQWLRGELSRCGLGPASADRAGRRSREASLLCDQDDVRLSAQTFVVDVMAMTGKADAGYTAALFERRAKMPLFARALLAHAMTLQKMRPEDVSELMRDAENHVRVTPTGATIAENLGSKYAPLLDSDNRTTAIVLRSLVTIDPKSPLASRLAKGLLAARRGGAWRTTQENAWALLGLDAYRKAQEKDAPDFDARVFLGDKLVFSAPFRERSVKAQSQHFDAAQILGRTGESLAFQVDGKGRLFYEARLRYAKKEMPDSPLDRGFFVRKLIRSVKPEAIADALRTLPETSATRANASDLVLVDLLVVSPHPQEQVVIDDPLPAGLEAVQTNLKTTARDLQVTDMGDDGDEGDAEDRRDVDRRAMGSTYQQSWYHREFHDDRVLTFVDRMAAGMYHYRYLARATTPGKYVVPPTKAECMYEPETFGRTGATTFEVGR